MGKISMTAKRIGFSEMNKTFEELATGKIDRRAILVPNQH
jgi:D-arabinose 1-dehydrogenase-like Zn-dependent alcohol dehydrogenase